MNRARLRPLFAVLLTALLAPALTRVEDLGYDTRLALRPDGGWPADLLLVPIDDVTIAEIGPWPWPRARQAELVSKLGEQGATTILLDVIHAAPGDPADDAALAATLGSVVLTAGFASHGGLSGDLPVLDVDLPALRIDASRITPPIRAFAERARGVGHAVFLEQSSDRRVRGHAPLLAPGVGPGVLPSAPLLALLLHRGGDPRTLRVDGGRLRGPNGLDVPLRRGEVLLDLVPGGTPPRTVSARDVLRASGGQPFAGSLAIVYVDSVYTPDRFATPLSGATPGGLLLASAVRTLEGGRVPTPLPRNPILAALLAASVLLAPRLVRRPTWILALHVAAIAVVVAAGALLARLDLFPPVASPAVFLLLSGAFLTVHASREVERERVRLRDLLHAARSLADPRTAPIASTEGTRGGLAGVLAGRGTNEPISGRYRVSRMLGRGGMGAVFLAEDTELERPVVLKVLERGQGADFLRFRREALAVARIAHPNVVVIYEVGSDVEVPYLVMEYAAGGSLAERIREEGPITAARAARLIASAARGLGAAHRAGVVHRDVKPANLLLTAPEADETKVADFGIAKLAGAEPLTQSGHFIGTIGYASPEQIRGTEVDARSDVFSLGVTWYRAVTGIHPFQGETVEVLRRMAAERLPDPRLLIPSMPEAHAALLLRMVAVEPAGRPRDGVAVAEAIEDALTPRRASADP